MARVSGADTSSLDDLREEVERRAQALDLLAEIVQ